jgi:hypothetical protein
LDSSFFPIYKAKLVEVKKEREGGVGRNAEEEEQRRVYKSTASASKQERSRG